MAQLTSSLLSALTTSAGVSNSVVKPSLPSKATVPYPNPFPAFPLTPIAGAPSSSVCFWIALALLLLLPLTSLFSPAASQEGERPS